MSMELRDIEYFAVVAEHRNLGRAAEALGLGQPALSKSLRRLELSARTKLVRRTPGGVDLTAAGVALLSHVNHLRLALDDVAHEVAEVGEGRVGHLRVGTGAGLGEHLLMPVCSAFLTAAPKVTLKITVGTNDLLMPALRRGELDLLLSGIYPAPAEGLVQDHVVDDDLVVYSSSRHRLAGRKRITLADIAMERWVVPAANALAADIVAWRPLVRTLEERGLRLPQVALESTSLLLRFRTVADSDLVGFTSRNLLEQFAPHFKLVELPVRELKWTRRVGVSYRKDGYLSPAARRFIDILKATAGGVAGKTWLPSGTRAIDREGAVSRRVIGSKIDT
jgi:DNA-binding transcriptional LysR family regulator